MVNYLASIIFLLSLGIACNARSFCPHDSLLSPCTCLNNDIHCTGSQAFDIKNTFTKMSEKLSENEKHFTNFYFNNTAINELNDNTFSDITFKAIHFEYAFNLSDIDVNAFNTTDAVTEEINFWQTPRLTQLEDNRLFHILSKFVNIETISLRHTNVTEIPDQAFGAVNGVQTKLWHIDFHGPSFSRLGERAFESLPALNHLAFGETSLTTLAENAFVFHKQLKNIPLRLFFGDNPGITCESFANTTLTHMDRPSTVYVGAYSPNKQYSYLSEHIFHPFFDTNTKNQLDLYLQLFDCNDCRNYWLTKYEELLGRIANMQCSNGKQFYDESNFSKC